MRHTDGRSPTGRGARAGDVGHDSPLDWLRSGGRIPDDLIVQTMQFKAGRVGRQSAGPTAAVGEAASYEQPLVAPQLGQA